MRRLTKGLLITGFVSFGAMSLPGCADNETMLFVQSVLALQDNCVAEADPDAPMWLGGVMDLAFTSQYNAVLLVGNQLVARGSRDQLRTESNRVVLKGAEVQILDDQENLIKEFTVPGTGFVHVGTATEPGWGLLATTLIPAGVTGIGPDALYIIDVRVFGDTLGGTEIESASLRFPIYTCAGCLLSFPLDADDPAVSGYQCTNTEQQPETTPCRLGQDERIDCRLCSANNPACQAP